LSQKINFVRTFRQCYYTIIIEVSIRRRSGQGYQLIL
jgi:hypothetical protein